MSDQTVYAEALIAATARAFYEDEHVVVVDVLLRDKFLRDDDMGPRLSLPAKQLRRTLQFLQDEQLVKFELVDDLSSGGSQATKFWYIDYNHAVNVIRLRVYLLRRKLEQAELRARSSSMYLCPGYKTKACNGRYTETEAQQIVDPETGLFLCQECFTAHESNPDPPPRDTYTLRLVDNTKDLRLAMDNMRRVNAQMTAKMIGNHQLRPGMYDLLQKVRSKGSGPLTSNLPTENFSMGIGSKRLAGTGRTAGIKAKKLAQQGVTRSEGAARRFLGGSTRTEEGSDLTFLKNAMGQEIAFEVEKGGGARANLLATRGRRQWKKLMDAAASRVGVEVDAATALLAAGRKRARDGDGDGGGGAAVADGQRNKKKNGGAPQTLEFLRNNIGRNVNDEAGSGKVADDTDDTDDENDTDDGGGGAVLDPTDEFRNLPEEERRVAFQAHYREEMARQLAILGSTSAPPRTVTSDENGADVTDEEEVEWEEG